MVVFPLVFSSASSIASNGNHRKTVNNDKTSDSTDISSLDRRRSFGDQEQVPSSHYSTEKSGSSGYYSSNVYSTSSVEDHIYSEPVIDGCTDRRRKFDQKFDQQIGLANLEKSIKTLEKHLKCLNKTNNKNDQQSKVIRNQEQIQESTIHTNANGNVDEHQNHRLPTIVEGMDNNNAMAMALVPYRRTDNKMRRQQTDWNADTTDDSLMDLDLDTFLLVDEMVDKKKKSNFNQIKCGEGIENPTFESDNEHESNADHPDDSGHDDLIDDDGLCDGVSVGENDEDEDEVGDVDDGDVDDEDDDDENDHRLEHTDNEGDNHNKSSVRNCDENNYKCTKYINSCPDDAYNVDEIADYKYEQAHFPFANKLLPFYMKNIEDQLNHQNTKDILEEIRDKLTILMDPNADEEHESSIESDGIGSSKSNSKAISLMRNITALKHDVDNYLVLMNQQNELEIRAFCTGLSKNYKLLTMQHALNNRIRRPKLSTSDIGSEVYSNSNSISNSSSSHHHRQQQQQQQHHQSLVRRKRRLKNQMKRNRKFNFEVTILYQFHVNSISILFKHNNLQFQRVKIKCKH